MLAPLLLLFSLVASVHAVLDQVTLPSRSTASAIGLKLFHDLLTPILPPPLLLRSSQWLPLPSLLTAAADAALLLVFWCFICFLRRLLFPSVMASTALLLTPSLVCLPAFDLVPLSVALQSQVLTQQSWQLLTSNFISKLSSSFISIPLKSLLNSQ